jgi:hypothetical protein
MRMFRSRSPLSCIRRCLLRLCDHIHTHKLAPSASPCRGVPRSPWISRSSRISCVLPFPRPLLISRTSFGDLLVLWNRAPHTHFRVFHVIKAWVYSCHQTHALVRGYDGMVVMNRIFRIVVSKKIIFSSTPTGFPLHPHSSFRSYGDQIHA